MKEGRPVHDGLALAQKLWEMPIDQIDLENLCKISVSGEDSEESEDDVDMPESFNIPDIVLFENSQSETSELDSEDEEPVRNIREVTSPDEMPGGWEDGWNRDDLEAEVSVPGPSGKRKLSEIEV